ncbi:DUF2716 domain-containing protein [Actinomadura kijaniata]|uniref:DUF2716 domain-containing protein n=1 Tax=Actinomadura kijaniata TaxID=46161 RepID=UPI0008366A92|nr:DUF2716 domain-containing protein [Actinomadura kijaniata]
MALDTGQLLAEHDDTLRGHVREHPRLGTVVERIGPLNLTHYGTHCVVDHPPLDAEGSASAARLAQRVQASAAARAEPVEWRVFQHDAAASHLSMVLDEAGFAAGWERGVLVGEVAELDFPEPEQGWEARSVRWDEPQAQQALDLAARTGPHRAPLATWHAMRSTSYWDVEVRVLNHHGTVTAACWLENVSDTAYAVIGGLTAARPELLAQLPLWRFGSPPKQFLVADADGEARDVLLAAGFREVTTVRSRQWTPPGEPAATPPARHSLDNGEIGQIARRCKARVGFDYDSGSGRYRAPADSRRWFYGLPGGSDDPAIAAAESVIERGLRACVRPGEWVYQYRPYLNGWEFDPHRVGGPGQPSWPGSAINGEEFQFLTTADARLGTFDHYAEQTLVVFGEGLLAQVTDDLDRLLGAGTWTFGPQT